MLETTQLPATFWGEAALTACYLWNRSESNVLPSGKTPAHSAHLLPLLPISSWCSLLFYSVCGAHCFARIPAELQLKLSPHSCHAIFLGYPEGVKGYCHRDKDTGAFFTARDVIFDENFPSITHSHDSDSDDEVVDTPPSHTLALPPPVPNNALIPVPSALTLPRRSGRSRIATEAGQAYAEGIAASKARLQALRETRMIHTLTGPSVLMTLPLSISLKLN
ncbi:hypothetical protein P692DRAFT_20736198 [Suillus brevipes Sb2]|nr:hypothetical protein P692DRAFT_20736198 [Suillus brevipes Sb2]